MNIIVFNEKHENRYFQYETVADLGKIGLKILKERYDAGYWYVVYDNPVIFEIIDEGVLSTISDPLKKSYLEELGKYNKHQKWHEESVAFLEDVKTALKDKDGYLAYSLLESRERYEYEAFERTSLETY